jgi:hypothetical protein
MTNRLKYNRGQSLTGIPSHQRQLDWIPALDRTHERKYAYRDLEATTASVERVMMLPPWHWTHDQGREGSCVGHGTGMERAVTNFRQNRLAKILSPVRRYDTIDIWNQAKIVDEWPDTNPGDDNGTSVHAGYDVCLNQGICNVDSMELVNGIPHPVNPQPRDLANGVTAVRWATTVDEMRTALANATPVTIGINWYTNFDNPVHVDPWKWPWIGTGSFGSVRGGHCVCVFGASDKRQAFVIKNSWGADYPLVWMPYTAMQRLLTEDGEAAISTDR